MRRTSAKLHTQVGGGEHRKGMGGSGVIKESQTLWPESLASFQVSGKDTQRQISIRTRDPQQTGEVPNNSCGAFY